MEKLYIVMPAYNEQASIEAVVVEWHAVVEKTGPESKLLILNDGSKDNTLGVLRGLEGRFPQLQVVDKPNAGHGPSCLLGYKMAVEQGADYIFQTDSDGQTFSADFWKFWENRHTADFLIGYRPRRGDGFMRWIISRVLRSAIFAIFRVDVKDANVPFRLMRAEKVAKYLTQIPSDMFLANALLPILLVEGKESIQWISIDFRPRTGGKPSVSLRRFIRVGVKVIKDFIGFKKTYGA